MIHKIIILIFLSVQCFGDNIPSYIKPCHLSDPNLDECALKSANEALPTFLKGHKKFKIQNMLPLKVSEVTIETGKLKVKLSNVESYSLPNLKLTNIHIDDKAKTWTVKATANVFEFMQDYELSGKILVLPVNGKGRANATSTDNSFDYVLTYKEIEKDGAKYMEVVDSKLEFTPKRVYYHFDNLFNGDKVLGDRVNKLIDDNWEEFKKEVHPAIVNVMRSLIDDVFKKLFTNIPKDEILLP